MNFLFTISLRNLFRQRRRSILLGSAIAFGTSILVLANAFSHGISEVLFNEIVAYVAGHVSVSFTKGGNPNNQVFHDGERMRTIINEQLGNDAKVDEAIGTFARAIGNGKSDNVILVGMDPKGDASEKEMKKLQKNFKLIEGSFEALSDSLIENPVGVAVDKAKSLNIKLNDVLRIRYSDIHGQTQAARLTVTTIFKPSNVFMSAPVFLNVKTIKKLLGYGEHDIAQLYLRIDNPKKNAVNYANKLHAALNPPLAVIDGSLQGRADTTNATLLALKTDSASLFELNNALNIVAVTPGDSAKINKKSLIISNSFARKHDISCGDTCFIVYKGKFDEQNNRVRLIINTIVSDSSGIGDNAIVVNEKEFYKAYYDVWPSSAVTAQGPFRPDTTIAIYKALGGEWLLLKRSKTTKEVIKSYRDVAQKGWKAIAVDVGSMYETASMVLNLEIALNMITFVCVMLLFFIILIGVINTLRMTIRERTREIGTIRAIGMQRNDVRNSFLIETGLLGLISAIAGIILAFCAMFGLSQITIKADDNPMSMLLVDGHLFFAPTVPATIFFIVLIVVIATLTAYFPAKRAAKLSAAEALRHFE